MRLIDVIHHSNPISAINYYTPKQLKLPLELEEIIEIGNPVYTFDMVMKGCNLKKYLVTNKDDSRGRIGYNLVTMLKIVLFAFTIKGYASTRDIADLCQNDIRFRWLLQYENSYPSHMTICNFMNTYLKDNIENIFKEINEYIFDLCKVNSDIVYIDGTKMEANANKYSWVWKNACLTNRTKLYLKITKLIEEINEELLCFECFRYKESLEYEIAYLEYIKNDFSNRFGIKNILFVTGKGRTKSKEQRYYEKICEYLDKLKEYAYKVETCGDIRNSYSKTDKDATFMRIKTDYMGNDQLLPAYNLQFGICDEFIAVADINQYASDTDCFVPLINKFKKTYGKYPEYPVADAGYGSYKNYIFCEELGIKKYMKFPMYKKETKDLKYHNDIYRSVNFKRDENNNIICPNNKKFILYKTRAVVKNRYGRVEELYQCENCEGCPLRDKCHNSKYNRIIKLNDELTSFHREVIDNLSSEFGIQLRINRSVQAEGTFGVMKQDRWYKRMVRKGLKNVNLEILMVSIGFNIYKLHNKLNRVIN